VGVFFFLVGGVGVLLRFPRSGLVVGVWESEPGWGFALQYDDAVKPPFLRTREALQRDSPRHDPVPHFLLRHNFRHPDRRGNISLSPIP